jgi:hypothetical protein
MKLSEFGLFGDYFGRLRLGVVLLCSNSPALPDIGCESHRAFAFRRIVEVWRKNIKGYLIIVSVGIPAWSVDFDTEPMVQAQSDR